MRWFQFLLICLWLVILFTAGCREDDVVNDEPWLIPKDAIAKGAKKDAIAALDNPDFVGRNSAQAEYLENEDLVLGIKSGEEAKAYPYKMLTWHEIINDEIGDLPIAVTYSPLTGTGIAWNRNIQGVISLFGVSGRLYNSNLIAFDRRTDSNWSQMLRKCVNGTLAETQLETIHMVATNWGTWQSMYPNTEVPAFATAYPRNYEYYPYENYRMDEEQLLFPVEPIDNRRPLKSIVHGVIIQGQAKAYPHSLFGDSIKVIEDSFQQEPIVVAGSAREDMVIAFQRQLEDGTMLSFEAVQDSLPVIMKDGKGNRWDIFGSAVEGPDQGEQLVQITNYDGYWLAWGAFYPEIPIYEGK